LQLCSAGPDGPDDGGAGRVERKSFGEVHMQMVMLIGAVLLSLVTAVGTASIVLALLLRWMSKLR
jgi:hypothetical protein